jgi:hypothetical protein
MPIHIFESLQTLAKLVGPTFLGYLRISSRPAYHIRILAEEFTRWRCFSRQIIRHRSQKCPRPCPVDSRHQTGLHHQQYPPYLPISKKFAPNNTPYPPRRQSLNDRFFLSLRPSSHTRFFSILWMILMHMHMFWNRRSQQERICIGASQSVRLSCGNFGL